ncbi:MAG: hypothetical protein KIT36_22030 [Alphaproteobacteria bacterium]|nr:hypothetical protein [Alphaproteobacteria bacterium]
MRLALIEWIDAAGLPDRFAGWSKLDDIRAHCEPVLVRSVGWLIVDAPERVVICPNLSADQYGDSPTAIPRAWIRRVVPLRQPDHARRGQTAPRARGAAPASGEGHGSGDGDGRG